MTNEQGWMTSDTDAEPTTDEASAEAEVEIIVARIEDTRDEMSETVALIGERLDPANIADQAKETVRDATVGRVERTVQGMTDTANEFMRDPAYAARQTGGGIVETIRRNPIPAAMAGIGIGMLVMNRQSSGGQAQPWRTGSGWTSDRYGDRYGYGSSGGYGSAYGSTGSSSGDGYTGDRDRSWGDGSSRGGQDVGQRLGRTAEDVGQRIGQTADEVGQRLERTADDLGRTVGSIPDRIAPPARQLGDVLSENALAAGAVAVAVGTAVGLALPTTRTERRVLGDAGRQLVGTAEQVATQGLSQVEQAARDAERQAEQQRDQARSSASGSSGSSGSMSGSGGSSSQGGSSSTTTETATSGSRKGSRRSTTSTGDSTTTTTTTTGSGS